MFFNRTTGKKSIILVNLLTVKLDFGSIHLCCSIQILYLLATSLEMYTEFGKAGVRVLNYEKTIKQK